MIKRILNNFIFGAIFILIMGLTGCPSPPSQSNATPPDGSGKSSSAVKFRVAILLDTGGKDDKSFNSAAVVGAERAKKELGISNEDVTIVESKQAADYKTNLTTLASQNYDVIFAVGLNMEDAYKEVVPQYPKVKFALVDGNAPEDVTNSVGLKFREEQGTFLAGFLAASVSKTKKIGFVGGMNMPLINKFEAGYRAGAKTAGFDPDKQVLTAYVGSWDDVTKGGSNAAQIFGNGADIVMQAAGKSGLGVIAAAKEKGKGFYAIGVDQDQDYIAEGRVLTSMVKHVDTAVFDTIKRVKENSFKSGTFVYDLKQGGVGLSEMKFTKADIPPDALAKLEKLTQLVKDEKVVPPTTLQAVKTFQPPKL